MTRLLIILSIILFPSVQIHGQTSFDEAKFDNVVQKMEGDVLEFARKVEELYAERCSIQSLQSCGSSNYDDCLSLYPSQTCSSDASFLIPPCGDGVTCSALFDSTVSSVRLPYELASGIDRNPQDYEVIETICFTRMLDDWFQTKRTEDYEYWQALNGAQPRDMLFGSVTGAFRIYPARQSENCGSYDPRLRPWYVAASSGPKNVIMVLDNSGSMSERGKLDVMKEAAQRVVNTLTFGDRVALVTFNSVASAITDKVGSMFQATDGNKTILNTTIAALVAENKTNYYAGFQKAFEIMKASIDSEYYVNCNTAILFLTDGLMTEPSNMTEAAVMDYIVGGIKAIQQEINQPVLLFTYSIAGDSGVENFPKELACATELGVWTNIEQPRDILGSLSSYYRLFSLGLGSDMNFTAWVEPYTFQTGGVLGTTVSAPVYDRTKNPPLFFGVVGIDFTIAALNAALGSNNNEESLNRIAQQSIARCPSLNLTLCDLESYRKQGGGVDAVCTNNCTKFIETVTQKCENVSEESYPTNLWESTANEGKPYTERVCCKVGTNTTSDECPALASSSDKNVGAIVGGVVGGLVFLCLIGLGVIWYCGGKDEHDEKIVCPSAPPPIPEKSENEIQKPPPTNPNALPRAMPVTISSDYDEDSGR